MLFLSISWPHLWELWILSIKYLYVIIINEPWVLISSELWVVEYWVVICVSRKGAREKDVRVQEKFSETYVEMLTMFMLLAEYFHVIFDHLFPFPSFHFWFVCTYSERERERDRVSSCLSLSLSLLYLIFSHPSIFICFAPSPPLSCYPIALKFTCYDASWAACEIYDRSPSGKWS